MGTTKPRRRRTKPQTAMATAFAKEDKATTLLEGARIIDTTSTEAALREEGRRGVPWGHSLEYDVKKGQVTSRPIFPDEIFKKPKPEPDKPLPNWKLHLIIFLVALGIGVLIGLSLTTRAHGAASEPPRIGRLTLPAPWWEIVKQAAQENDLDPVFLIPWLKICALHYEVDPEFAIAVAIVESRPAGGLMEIRIGPIGKHGKCVGPMGIARCFKNKYDIYNPFVNIEIGVKALRGNELKALKRYNALFNSSYYKEVIRVKKELKKNKDCDIKITSRCDVASTTTAPITTKPSGRFRQ